MRSDGLDRTLIHPRHQLHITSCGSIRCINSGSCCRSGLFTMGRCRIAGKLLRLHPEDILVQVLHEASSNHIFNT